MLLRNLLLSSLAAASCAALADSVDSFKAGKDMSFAITGGNFTGPFPGNLTPSPAVELSKPAGSLNSTNDFYKFLPQFGLHADLTLTGVKLNANLLRWNVSAPTLIGKTVNVTISGLTVPITVDSVSGHLTAAVHDLAFPKYDAAAHMYRTVSVASYSPTSNVITIAFHLYGSAYSANFNPLYSGIGGPKPAPFPTILSIGPLSLVGGNGNVFNAKVTSSEIAPAGGFVVGISDPSAQLYTPATVTIPAGSTFVAFTMPTANSVTTQRVPVNATLNGYTKTSFVTIKPMLAGLTATKSLVGGIPGAGSVSLNELAKTVGGVNVALASDNAALKVPAVATVPVGTNHVTFNFTTVKVLANTQVHITATLKGVVKTFTVTLTP